MILWLVNLGLGASNIIPRPGPNILFMSKPELIRVDDGGYQMIAPPQDFTIRLRHAKPGSIERDGEYGHTSS